MQIRKFLNKPGNNGIAAVLLNYDRDGGSVTISDCSRQIVLDLSAYTKADRRNTLYKLDTLIDVLEAARALVEEST